MWGVQMVGVNTANHSQSQSKAGLWLVQSDLLGPCSLAMPMAEGRGAGRARYRKHEPSKVSTKYLYGSSKAFPLAVLPGSSSQRIVTRKHTEPTRHQW
ncbi:hypothetical protein E2C01_010673 [Portunus trituberculatus]|uniref:Uncharacterized protein n=1 Tax=Portunus trituberculatus TaxID=210409 RepID=A0A5B7D920_PORTR|nr:hypothetical protein [Portunus trituberculatus]